MTLTKTPPSDAAAPRRAALPEQPISREVLIEKYAKGKETSITEVRHRVARALAQAEPEEQRAQWERRFLQAQEDGFIPAGRINSAAGTSLTATLINCFVQPVGDSITELVDGPSMARSTQSNGRGMLDVLIQMAREFRLDDGQATDPVGTVPMPESMRRNDDPFLGTVD